MSTYAWVAIAIVAATLVPVTLLVMREVIRKRRSAMLSDLLATLFKDNPDIPTLEFARNKYGVRSDHRDDPAAVQSLTRTRTLFASAIPYFLFSAAGFALVFVPICALTSVTGCSGSLIVPSLMWTNKSGTDSQVLLNHAAIVGAAFLGGYLFTLRFLLRAVMNFELNPITWLRSAAHLIGGTAIALLIFRTLSNTAYIKAGMNLGVGDDPLHLGLALAFVAGYVPDFGMVTLLRSLRISHLKSIDPEVMKSAGIVPIEVIDGIDYDIRYRLEENNVSDIQNLATSNPVLLFVETPYGLYQSFDWVLQAQLCLVTGPRIFFELKKHNIRTILDLERAVLGDGAPPAYVRMIGSVLFSDAAKAERDMIMIKPEKDGAPPELDVASIRHAVMVMADDLHVHRLRQLWSVISEKLGREWIYSKGQTEGSNNSEKTKPPPTR